MNPARTIVITRDYVSLKEYPRPLFPRPSDRKPLVRAITVLVLSIIHPSFQPQLNHEPTILRVEYKNDTISTKPFYFSDSPTPTDTQKQKTEGSALMPLQALQKNGKIPMLQFWETWRYSLVKFRTIYRALV